MLSINLIGRLGSDVKKKEFASGDTLWSISVATTIGYGDKAYTQWCDVVLPSLLASKLEKFLTKGTALAIVGALSKITLYDGKPKLVMRADRVEFLPSNKEANEVHQKIESSAPTDDVPF